MPQVQGPIQTYGRRLSGARVFATRSGQGSFREVAWFQGEEACAGLLRLIESRSVGLGAVLERGAETGARVLATRSG